MQVRAGLVSMSEPSFKYHDYFAGIGRTPQRVPSIAAALQLFHAPPGEGGDVGVQRPSPRFTLAEIERRAISYVRNFPFEVVCNAG